MIEDPVLPNDWHPVARSSDIIALQDQITSHDIPVVKSKRPERLPLDLQAELHLRSDRIAVAYRKWLKQLGLSFGTA